MYVVGTAGHVDHGKSTLVERLTGIDPDRFVEEKERGMTIDLGFAWLDLPSGNQVSIVDVPGHERFINNMLAGIGGIDLALIVVAADESVMPQTREHVAILDLLQVKHGLVALTKSDLVDSDWLDLVEGDINEALQGTTMEGIPVLRVSGVTGEGMSLLISKLDNLLQDVPIKRSLGRPRLPIDRSFTVQGFGTVVTGTLTDGSLTIGSEMELVLSGEKTRIRGLQTHKRNQPHALPGNRVAANLSGISPDKISRGEVMASPGWLNPTMAIDVSLRVVADSQFPISHNMFVTVHSGSNEVIAKVRLLDKQRSNPGDITWAQLKLNSPIAVVKGDYFVVRSNRTTLGGGTIVDTHARRHRRMHSPTLSRLETMSKGSESDIILKTIEMSEPCEFSELVSKANLEFEYAKNIIDRMASDSLVVVLGQKVVKPGDYLYTKTGFDSVVEETVEYLKRYHAKFPLRQGAPKEEVRSRLDITPQIFNQILAMLVRELNIVESGAIVRLTEHSPSFSELHQEVVKQYISLLESDRFAPPTDVIIDTEVVNALVDQGQVVRVSDSVTFSMSAYVEMVDGIAKHINEHGQITIANVRDIFGTSRKYALALMDYLDKERVTRRVGDVRILR